MFTLQICKFCHLLFAWLGYFVSISEPQEIKRALWSALHSVPACRKPVITLALNIPHSLDSSMPSREFWMAERGVLEGDGKKRKIMTPFTFCRCLLFPLSLWSSRIPRWKSLVSSEPKSPWSEQLVSLSRWPVGWHRALQVLFFACLYLWIAKHILARPTDHLRQSHSTHQGSFCKILWQPFPGHCSGIWPWSQAPSFPESDYYMGHSPPLSSSVPALLWGMQLWLLSDQPVFIIILFFLDYRNPIFLLEKYWNINVKRNPFSQKWVVCENIFRIFWHILTVFLKQKWNNFILFNLFFNFRHILNMISNQVILF